MALYLGTIAERKVVPFSADLDSVKRQVLALAGDNTDEILIEVYPDPNATGASLVTGIRFDSEIDDWVHSA